MVKSELRRRKRMVFTREGRGGEEDVRVVVDDAAADDDGREDCNQEREMGSEWVCRRVVVICVGMSDEGVAWGIFFSLLLSRVLRIGDVLHGRYHSLVVIFQLGSDH